MTSRARESDALLAPDFDDLSSSLRSSWRSLDANWSKTVAAGGGERSQLQLGATSSSLSSLATQNSSSCADLLGETQSSEFLTKSSLKDVMYMDTRSRECDVRDPARLSRFASASHLTSASLPGVTSANVFPFNSMTSRGAINFRSRSLGTLLPRANPLSCSWSDLCAPLLRNTHLPSATSLVSDRRLLSSSLEMLQFRNTHLPPAQTFNQTMPVSSSSHREDDVTDAKRRASLPDAKKSVAFRTDENCNECSSGAAVSSTDSNSARDSKVARSLQKRLSATFKRHYMKKKNDRCDVPAQEAKDKCADVTAQESVEQSQSEKQTSDAKTDEKKSKSRNVVVRKMSRFLTVLNRFKGVRASLLYVCFKSFLTIS